MYLGDFALVSVAVQGYSVLCIRLKYIHTYMYCARKYCNAPQSVDTDSCNKYVHRRQTKQFIRTTVVVNYRLACLDMPQYNVSRIFRELSSCQVARRHLANIYIQFHIHMTIRYWVGTRNSLSVSRCPRKSHMDCDNCKMKITYVNRLSVDVIICYRIFTYNPYLSSVLANILK